MNVKQIQEALENYRQENHMELATMSFGDIIDACSQHLKECAIVLGEKQYVEGGPILDGSVAQVFTVEIVYVPDPSEAAVGFMDETNNANYIMDNVGDGNYKLVKTEYRKLGLSPEGFEDLS